MIFYIALHNTDNCKYRIFTRMVKCIEEVEVNDKECEMMQLLGGDMGEIRSQCYKNITLLYPNMYLHNRKGYCIIAIKFISEDNQVLEKKTNISFNTNIGSKGRKQSLMSSYYEKMSYTPCESVDLDPLQNCAPVDCHMKYLGTRSFFNRKWKRCQKVPVCVFDIEKDLPDVGYTPVTNKCIDLERCIKKSDLGPLDNKYAELGDVNGYSLMLTAINCHYGKINNQSGVCDCIEGWTSAPFDKEPTLFPIHMCNIELSSWYDSNRTEITFVAFIISVVAVAIAMIVVLISFILYHLYKCLRSMEGIKPQCYCDLEAGIDDDTSKKEKKKGRTKSEKRTPSKESKGSKESKDTKESKESKVSKETKDGKESKENLHGKESKKSRKSKESLQSEPEYKEEQELSNKDSKAKKKTLKSNERASDQSLNKEASSKTNKKSKTESMKQKPSASSLSNPSNTSLKDMHGNQSAAQQPVAPVTPSKKKRK